MNPMKMMRQFEEMQTRLQKELAETQITASAGGEMVTVTMNGKKEVVAVKIDPQVVSAEDIDMLQDLVVAAFNECGRKVDETVATKVSGMTSGLKLPIPGF